MAFLKIPVASGDHTRGVAYPSISIVEYGDFQCFYCGRAESYLQALLSNFGTEVSVTFRNFPLTEVHAYAFDAACAAEAAGKQGKFWEMHDLLYQNQDRLGDELFLDLAQSLGLNEVRFVTDSISQAVHAKIRNDFETGAESGVSGTPTFFIDGHRFDGAPADLFVAISERID